MFYTEHLTAYNNVAICINSALNCLLILTGGCIIWYKVGCWSVSVVCDWPAGDLAGE